MRCKSAVLQAEHIELHMHTLPVESSGSSGFIKLSTCQGQVDHMMMVPGSMIDSLISL